MVKKRNVGMAVLLSFVTLGIYAMVWFVQLTNQVNELSGEDGTSGGKAILFSILTCGIYMLFWSLNLGKKMHAAQLRLEMPASDNSMMYLLFTLFGLSIVTMVMVQLDINKIAESNFEAV